MSATDNQESEADNEQSRDGHTEAGRFPDRDSFYAQLHLLLANKVPDPKLLDDAVATLEGSDAIALNKLRRGEVSTMIRETSSRLQGTFEQMGEQQRQDELMIDDIGDFGEYLQAHSHGSHLPIFDTNCFIAFEREIIGESTVVQFIECMCDNTQIFDRRINDLAELKGWDRKKTVQFLSKISSQMVRSINVGERQVIPLDLLYQTCDLCLRNATHHYRYQTDYIPSAIAGQLDMDGKSLDANLTPFSAEQTIDDRQEISLVEAQGALSRSFELLQNLRSATDTIRTKLIPDLIQREVSFQEAFWAIHKAHFEAQPLLGHMHSSDLDEVPDYARSGGADFYRNNVGQTRKNYVQAGWASFVDVKHLSPIENVFFERLQEAAQHVSSNEEFLNLIAKADMFLITSHLPFDGAGRTTEDFLVFLGQKLGYPLTISTNGYRHMTSPLVDSRTNANGDFKQENDVRCLQNLGITVDTDVNRDNWKEYINQELNKKFGPKGRELFISEKAVEAQRIIDTLSVHDDGTDAITERYQSYSSLRKVWEKARSQKYSTTNVAVAEECEEVLAEVSTDFSAQTLDRLRALQGNHADDTVVSEVTSYYLEPQTVMALERMSRVLREQDKQDELLACFRHILELKPGNSYALNELAFMMRDQDKDDEAEKLFRDAIERNPKNPAGYDHLGNLMSDHGRADEADAMYRKALDIDSHNASAHNNLGLLLLNLDNDFEAEGHLREAIRCEPGMTNAHWNLAKLLNKRGFGEDAFLEYRAATMLSPDNPYLQCEFARSLKEHGRIQAANDHYREALAIMPDYDDAQNELALLLKNHGGEDTLPEARELLQQIIQRSPDYAHAHNNLGFIYLSKDNDYDSAESCFRKTLEIDHGYSMGHLNLADLFSRTNRNEEARAHLDAFLDVGGDRGNGAFQRVNRQLQERGV